MNKYLIIGASESYGTMDVRKHYQHSIINKINLDDLINQELISKEEYQKLITIYPDKKASIWGISDGPKNKEKWDLLKANDLVLFYNQTSQNINSYNQEYKVHSKMSITYKLQSQQLSNYIWNDQSFSNIIFLNNEEELDISWEELNKFNLAGFKNPSQKYLRSSFLYQNENDINSINQVINNYTKDFEEIIKEVATDNNFDSQALLISGELTKTGITKVRAEQAKLRKWILKEYSLKPGYCLCVLCEKELPENLIKTAHLKPRNDPNTSNEERQDQYIVVPMCDLGCDRLYELGYLYINDDQTVQLNHHLNINKPIEQYYQANFLINNQLKTLKWLKKENMKYIEYKRNQLFK